MKNKKYLLASSSLIGKDFKTKLYRLQVIGYLLGLLPLSSIITLLAVILCMK